MRPVALLAAAAAVALLFAPAARLPPNGLHGRSAGGRPRPGPWLLGTLPVALPVALPVGLVGLLGTVDGLRLALAAVVAGAAGGAGLLVQRSRAARAAERRRALVVDVAEALVGELLAGQPLLRSLEHCVEVWPEFEAIVSAARLGADVPSALRRLAGRPGAEGLREVASAWQVAERSGAGLAAALAQVAASARFRARTRHLVQGELASAQATARLVALLPVASLAMSAGIGGHPWHFLLGTAPGLACLAGGVVLALCGLLWVDRIAAGVLRG